MARLDLHRTLIGAAVAVALGVVTGPASALRFAGTFDPYTFEGSYVIDVDSECLAGDDGWKLNSGGPLNSDNGLCEVILESASAAVLGDFNGNLTFAPPALGLPQVYGVNVVGGTVALNAFDTTWIPFVAATSDPTTDDWWIQFVSGAMPTVIVSDFAVPSVGPSGSVNLYVSNEGQANAELADTAAFTSIRAIPEPGTLGLLLGALGTGWLARRRKGKAAS